MSTQPNPQSRAAHALAQLSDDYPDLPLTIWSVDRDRLRGHVYGPEVGNFDAVHAYVSALGGVARPGFTYEHNGDHLRSYLISIPWPNVHVEVSVSIPADLHDPALMEGLLAAQQHDWADPAVPVEVRKVTR